MKFKLKTKLNISFTLVLFLPMAFATLFSILYFDRQIREEAGRAMDAKGETTEMIFRDALGQMVSLAEAYARNRYVRMLLPFNMGKKIGREFSVNAVFDGLDMVTIVDRDHRVLVRSHAPDALSDELQWKVFMAPVLEGKTISGIELLSQADLKREYLPTDAPGFPRTDLILSATGIAPIFNSNHEEVIAVLIARRFIDSRGDLIQNICQKLNTSAGIFARTQLVAAATSSASDPALIRPDPGLLLRVQESSTRERISDFRIGGHISSIIPLTDFWNRSVGAILLQERADHYIHSRRTAIVSLSIISVVSLLLMLIVKNMTERALIQPIRQLKRGIDQIGHGERALRLAVVSDDEIGDLTRAFNDLTLRLERTDAELKQYHAHLEERVLERTAELEATNQSLTKVNEKLADTLELINPGISGLIGSNRQQIGLVDATLLVVDVCDYTKLNMILGDALMGEIMTLFFSATHQLLAMNSGTFDKIVGDEVRAIFGLPKDACPSSPQHAFDAVFCALRIQKAATRINDRLKNVIQENYADIVERIQSIPSEDRRNIDIQALAFRCRIGINTSNRTSTREIDQMRMVMMGAETFMDYTSQGGAAIYTFRLEKKGLPGEIHVGRNTRAQVEHVFRLDEIPPVELKGLGIQPRYRVISLRPLFDTLYPRTAFYQRYCNNIPGDLIRLFNSLKLGKVQIHEVKKISAFIDVFIPDVEHACGVFNLCLARALFAYAIGKAAGLAPDEMITLMTVSLWTNANRALKRIAHSYLYVPFPAESQVPAEADPDSVVALIAAMNDNRPDPMANIIRIADHFDSLAFDRTYLKERQRKVVSPQKAIAMIRIEGRHDRRLIDCLERLMVVADDRECITDTCMHPAQLVHLPQDLETLAEAIDSHLTPEQREELVARISQSKAQDHGRPPGLELMKKSGVRQA